MFYKEWIKTRWALLLILIVTCGYVGYELLNFLRAIGAMGGAHIWIAMITKDEPMFVRHLQYIPMMAGVALACVQFFPEMYHKCLKLTLHLPCSHLRMMFEMLGFGLVALLVCFGLNYLILWLGMRPSLAPELYGKMLLVALPWYLAGFAAYLLSAGIILEGSWARRIFNLVVMFLCLKVFYLSSFPGTYVPFLPCLVVFVLACILLPWISIDRFKKGIE